jgi:hypothetical protein
VVNELGDHPSIDRGTWWTPGVSGGQVVNTIQNVTQVGATLPLHVVDNVPGLQGGESVAWSAPGMYPCARRCECAKDELWDAFYVTKMYELLDRARVVSHRGTGPTVPNRPGDMVSGARRE